MADPGAPLPDTPLVPADQEALRDALLQAFPNQRELDDLLHYRWGFALGDELNLAQGRRYVYGDLVTFTDGEGRGRDLLALALAAKPNNPLLRPLAIRLLPDPVAAAARYAAPALVAAPALPATLEALVDARSRLVDFGDYLQRVTAIGPRLCRVAAGRSKGTGFLVGASHVLTNFHVVEGVATDAAALAQAVCLFDYWKSSDQAAEPSGTPVKLAADPLVLSSRYSASDLSGRGDPAATELDFALLRLAEPVGTARGFFALPDKPSVVTQGDVVMIPQHADGKPLEVAYGAIVALPGSGLRYRYSVTTAHGSSGAPLFTAELTPLGLHHAADPDAHPDYNQAVPLWRVARALAAAGKDPTA